MFTSNLLRITLLSSMFMSIYAIQECKLTPTGSEYYGTRSTTTKGYTCQRWDIQYPNTHTFVNVSMFPDTTITNAANYCRNPDNSASGPWCITTDPSIFKDNCDIPDCDCRWGVGFNVSNPIPSPYIYHASTTAVGSDTYNARINHASGGWCAQPTDLFPWFDSDFRGYPLQVTGLSFQGGPDGKNIRTFNVGYFTNTLYVEATKPIMLMEGGIAKIFSVHMTGDNLAYVMFPDKINCTFLRVFILTYEIAACMRVEPVGCGGLLAGDVYKRALTKTVAPSPFNAIYQKIGSNYGPRPDPLWTVKMVTSLNIDLFHCAMNCAIGDTGCVYFYYEDFVTKQRCITLKSPP